TASVSGATVSYTLAVQTGGATQARSETVLMRVTDAPPTPFPTATVTKTPTIGGLAFQPDIVIVRDDNGDQAIIRTSSMPANASKEVTTSNALLSNGILA